MKLDRQTFLAILVVILLSAFFAGYVISDKKNGSGIPIPAPGR
jgi:hypothetical protein